ncbi:DNA glycosylase [Hypoxylon sp. NC1633]|nr:DNA glycosylase [Hypoxylon sp. NC1633]
MPPRAYRNIVTRPCFYTNKLRGRVEQTIACFTLQRLRSSHSSRSAIYSSIYFRRFNPSRFTYIHSIPPNGYQIVNMATRRSARLSAASTASKNAPPPPGDDAPPLPVPKGRKRKAASDELQQESLKGALEEKKKTTPATPKKRRSRKSDIPPPATPTPSNVQLIGEPVTTYETPKPKAAAVRRLADPNATNATLLSPETSRIIARDVSPSKAAAGQVTTANILEEACKYLIKVDERMKPLIEKNPCRVFSPEGLSEKIDPFESLCSGIVSQQVSGAAAKAIKQRFIDLFDNDEKFPHPSQVSVCTIERLRTAGLSQRKAEYIKGLAEKFASGELSAQILADESYDTILEKLIAVRGLGRWSVEMFACFGLKRMDVFSLGDLGVQRGMAAFVGRDVAKLKNKGGKWKYMSENEMKELSEKFAPYRSVFMWYMWRVEDTDISTLE